jgi:hypothetical protein
LYPTGRAWGLGLSPVGTAWSPPLAAAPAAAAVVAVEGNTKVSHQYGVLQQPTDLRKMQKQKSNYRQLSIIWQQNNRTVD